MKLAIASIFTSVLVASSHAAPIPTRLDGSSTGDGVLQDHPQLDSFQSNDQGFSSPPNHRDSNVLLFKDRLGGSDVVRRGINMLEHVAEGGIDAASGSLSRIGSDSQLPTQGLTYTSSPYAPKIAMETLRRSRSWQRPHPIEAVNRYFQKKRQPVGPSPLKPGPPPRYSYTTSMAQLRGGFASKVPDPVEAAYRYFAKKRRPLRSSPLKPAPPPRHRWVDAMATLRKGLARKVPDPIEAVHRYFAKKAQPVGPSPLKPKDQELSKF